jgi:hypothetical protein
MKFSKFFLKFFHPDDQRFARELEKRSRALRASELFAMLPLPVKKNFLDLAPGEFLLTELEFDDGTEVLECRKCSNKTVITAKGFKTEVETLFLQKFRFVSHVARWESEK